MTYLITLRLTIIIVKHESIYYDNMTLTIIKLLKNYVVSQVKLKKKIKYFGYVFRITHVPRLEDWSVMPVRIGFMLQPHGFFNCSPAMDVPPSPGACESDVKEGHVKESIATKSEEVIRTCRSMGKAIIVATNMLESMIVHPTPTRAEVSELLLFPLKAVNVMHTVSLRTESSLMSGGTLSSLNQAFQGVCPIYMEFSDASEKTFTDALSLLKPLICKTDSFAKMDKLKFLQLKYVKLMGSNKNFPKLRWLCWHGCYFTKIPSSLLMSALVAIDMSYGNLKTFEPLMVLNSLKILNLKESCKLVSINKLSWLPNLENLILWNYSSLNHVCESIGGLESLVLLDFTRSNINLLKRLKTLCIGGGIPKQSLFSLPDSLKFLFLNNCDLGNNNDVPLVFSGQPLFYMNLGNNMFKKLPSNINLKTLRVLKLTFCPNIKSLLSLPSTLEELYTYWCFSLKEITFESHHFILRKFMYQGCSKVFEVQGLFKLVSVAELDEAELGHMKWIKTYKDCRGDLVSDEISRDRIWHTLMLNVVLLGLIGTRLLCKLVMLSLKCVEAAVQVNRNFTNPFSIDLMCLLHCGILELDELTTNLDVPNAESLVAALVRDIPNAKRDDYRLGQGVSS
uniref:Pyruvate kinase barrel domain-containing protein n=1 Tax=Lactuca sativa TaxID=4236 RepID=A0A9R1UQD4_LACSA|nr:hypothetical protein LSAT_V11C800429690 [Lactuca sativa]